MAFLQRNIFLPHFFPWTFSPPPLLASAPLPSNPIVWSSPPYPHPHSSFPSPSLKQSSITLIHLHYLIWVHSPDEASLLDGDCPILFLSIRAISPASSWLTACEQINNNYQIAGCDAEMLVEQTAMSRSFYLNMQVPGHREWWQMGSKLTP